MIPAKNHLKSRDWSKDNKLVCRPSVLLGMDHQRPSRVPLNSIYWLSVSWVYCLTLPDKSPCSRSRSQHTWRSPVWPRITILALSEKLTDSSVGGKSSNIEWRWSLSNSPRDDRPPGTCSYTSRWTRWGQWSEWKGENDWNTGDSLTYWSMEGRTPPSLSLPQPATVPYSPEKYFHQLNDEREIRQQEEVKLSVLVIYISSWLAVDMVTLMVQ